MDYTGLNFVETCETTDTGSSSVRTCYNSATTLNEILLITVFFLTIFFIITKLFSGNIFARKKS